MIVNWITAILNWKLRLGYDIGKGYVTCTEDVASTVTDIIDDEQLAIKIQQLLKATRVQVMKEIGNFLLILIYRYVSFDSIVSAASILYVVASLFQIP